VLSEPWYRNALFYSLAVETFQDSNGDGIGDIPGLTSRLDYLESLGVDVVWLAPCYPTPNRDAGYDITDYYGIDPRLGTSGDFAELLREAAGRGMRVILDLVVNHTSDQHPWFSSPSHHDWYVWSDKKPRNLRAGVVFPGVQETVWSYRRDVRQWYFHRFYDFQPDLNMENPAVREEIARVVGYWLKLGVAGFRVDAVPFLLEKARPNRKPILHFEHLHELREELEWRASEAILLGEANVVPREDAEYFSEGRGLHMMFDFWVNQHLFASLATGDARLVGRALEQTRKIPAQAQWAHFLRNHDELDLGRLDPQLRKAVFAELAPEESMQLYGRGIRRRLAPMLGERARIELAYSLMLALPGAPVIRYGEEIGMGENLRLKERNAIRTPMQWSDGPNGGFSTAHDLVRPANGRGPYGYQSVNVDSQLRDPSSLLRTIAGLVRVRKQCPEIGRGAWSRIATRRTGVLALRYGDVVTAHNLGDAPVEVSLGGPLRDLLGRDAGTRSGRVRLEPYGSGWWRVD
jgi:maltose alpha-D-glucosyltransferase/alpha-amylase